MSIAQTWFERSIVKPRKQVRIHDDAPGAARGLGTPIQRLDPHLAPSACATCLRPTFEAFSAQRVAQHPRTRERMLQVQLVDAAHQRQIRIRLPAAAGSTPKRG